MGNKTIRAKIQCFPDTVVVTREQVKDLIKSEGIKPSDLFDAGSLCSDPVVRGFADDRVKERLGQTWREKMEALEERDKLKTEKSELEKQVGAHKATAAKAQVGSLFEKQKAERKLDDRQMKFVQRRLPRFNPSKPEEIEKEFNAWLDSEIDDYKAEAKEVFGIEDKPAGDKGEIKPTPGAEPSGSPPGETPDKYLDPKTNPFIRTD